MREEDVLQVLGGSFFNSVLVDIEKNTYTRMNFAPWLLKISQTGMYTGLADFIVCNSAVEEDVVFRQHEVGGHHLDAALRLAGQDAVGVGGQRVRDAEGLRDGRSGDVGVQDAHVLPALLHFAGKQAGDQRLAHAALAGHDADDVFDVGAGVRLDGAGALGGAVAASGLAAAAALVRAFFCHDSFFLGFQRPRAAGAPLVSPG